jgi:DNA polymerase-3 subunit alpha
MQQSSDQMTNTLFGNLNESIEMALPKIAPCDAWTLTEQLNHEKDVTGMFISGHPLDHFKFELKYFGISSISEYHEMEEAIAVGLLANPGRTIRLAGLVVSAMHRTTRTGKNYANLAIEDYSGKMEVTLWSQDYARFSNFLNPGMTLFVTGNFKPRMRRNGEEMVQDGWEFQVKTMQLLETLRTQAQRLELTIASHHLSRTLVDFFDKNIRKHHGTTAIKFLIKDEALHCEVEMVAERGVAINDDLANFLYERDDVQLKIISNNGGPQ